MKAKDQLYNIFEQKYKIDFCIIFEYGTATTCSYSVRNE